MHDPEMPAHLPNAFIAIEDRRFRSHHGVDPVGLLRAVFANLLHRGISQGGSTITQQLAQNLFLTPERAFAWSPRPWAPSAPRIRGPCPIPSRSHAA